MMPGREYNEVRFCSDCGRRMVWDDSSKGGLICPSPTCGK